MNYWIIDEIKGKIKYLETQGNEDRKYQNLWDKAKAVLRGKYIATQTWFDGGGKKELKQII